MGKRYSSGCVVHGEMAERLNATVLKTADLAMGPRVRIPVSPDLQYNNYPYSEDSEA